MTFGRILLSRSAVVHVRAKEGRAAFVALYVLHKGNPFGPVHFIGIHLQYSLAFSCNCISTPFVCASQRLVETIPTHARSQCRRTHLKAYSWEEGTVFSSTRSTPSVEARSFADTETAISPAG